VTRTRHAMVFVATALAFSAAGAGAAIAAGRLSGGGTGSGMHQAVYVHRGARPLIRAAASYLGLTVTELRTQLRSGKSLAQVAAAQGKSVSGLKDAILAAAKTRLDQAVAAGRLTAAQEQTILDRLKMRLDAFVNRTGFACRS
jgi:hypothetical protein